MEMNPSSSELPGFTVMPDLIGRLLLPQRKDCRSGPAMT